MATPQQKKLKSTDPFSKLWKAYYFDCRQRDVIAYKRMEMVEPKVMEFVGDKQIGRVTRHDISRFVQDRRKQVKDSTVARDLSPIRAALRFAEREGIIAKAPDLGGLVSTGDARKRWLSPSEAKTLLAAAEADPQVHLAITLALKTGQRLSAILELTWDRVSLETGYIEFAKPDDKFGKRRKGRAYIPISSGLRETLRRAASGTNARFVIEGNHPECQQGIVLFIRRFNKVRDRAGLGKDVTFHTLRHTAASWMVMRGVSIYEVSQLLAHRSVEITRKYYAHLDPNALKRGSDTLDDMI